MNNYIIRIKEILSTEEGQAMLKLYLHRSKNDKWGQAYHQLQKMGYSDVPSTIIKEETRWIIGIIIITLMGIIITIFGFSNF